MGNDVLLSLEGEMITCSRELSFDTSRSDIDATCKEDDGAKKSIPGQIEWSVTTTFIVKNGTEDNTQTVVNAYLNKTLLEGKVTSDNSGDYEWAGDAYIMGIGQTFEMNDITLMTLNVVGVGEPTYTEIPV